MLAKTVFGALGTGLHHAFGEILALIGFDLHAARATDGSQDEEETKHAGMLSNERGGVHQGP